MLKPVKAIFHNSDWLFTASLILSLNNLYSLIKQNTINELLSQFFCLYIVLCNTLSSSTIFLLLLIDKINPRHAAFKAVAIWFPVKNGKNPGGKLKNPKLDSIYVIISMHIVAEQAKEISLPNSCLDLNVFATRKITNNNSNSITKIPANNP